jgi:methionine-rich copper-binding protein CopC
VTAVAGAVAALGLLLVPGRADAHAELVSTEPAASQQLTTAPDQVVLHFTESVDMTDDTIEVLDATGTRVQVGEPEHPGGDGAAVAASLPDLDDGAYVVAWRVVGPLPEDVDQILFPSIQTYASGEVVRWIDEPLESGEEPEHPAPLLTLVDGGDEHSDEAAAEEETAEGDATANGETATGVSVSNTASQDDVDSANTLATVGIVVGVLGLLAGGFAIFRSRRSA